MWPSAHIIMILMVARSHYKRGVQYNTTHNTTQYTGARWFGLMFGALQLEGCGFESTSKPPRRDPGQVLHSQLLMRFGVKLRLSVHAVVGSASEWESVRGAITSVQIQYNTIQRSLMFQYLAQ